MGVHDVTLDRRNFLLLSARWGTATALTPLALAACEREGNNGPADGSYGLPYTRDDPGEWTDKVEIHQPVLYGSRIDPENVRLWVEVQDTQQQPVKNHEMTADHYISSLVLVDNFQNTIAAREFAYDAQARLVATVQLDERVTSIEALELCNLHGWWSAVYDVADIDVPPQGDFRRAFTREGPGDYAAQVATHVPVFGKRPNGRHSVEVGDRENDSLHPMDEGHYIQEIFVFDQYDQLRAQGALGPAYQEPVIDFPPVGGTDRVRVLAYCNNYQWWEAEYAVI